MSGKYHDSLIDIQERWSLKDLLDAHDVLDLFDRIDRRVHDRHEAERERAQRKRGGFGFERIGGSA